MNDPWDVKSVRQSGQYISCMKINGVPLLPPLLSKDCRKEMQYYKLLAKEVEDRIRTLKAVIVKENIDVPDATKMGCHCSSPLSNQSSISTSDESQTNNKKVLLVGQDDNTISMTQDSSDISKDMLLDMENSEKHSKHTSESSSKSRESDITVEVPVRDNDESPESTPTKKVDNNSCSPDKQQNVNSIIHFSIDINNFDQYLAMGTNLDGQDSPSSLLNSKSFTGSLIDIHREKNTTSPQSGSTLTRQSSYTLLKPSPQLLAHLKVEAEKSGVDVMSISMSDSLSYLSLSPTKKRRSWDLEAAKNKWSNMALEMKKRNSNNKTPSAQQAKTSTTPANSKAPVASEKLKQSSVSIKPRTMSEPVKQTPKKCTTTQNQSISTKKSVVKESTISPYKKMIDNTKKDSTPKSQGQQTISSNKTLISESEDPASKVRELYNKIKRQQQMQIANLVEKQKREQLLLRQTFEEQNNILYNQIKCVCPKSPIEIKQAWGEIDQEGPVSLSQLIHKKSSTGSDSSPPSVENYINQCDNILRKSRDITDSFKKDKKAKSPTRNHSTARNQSSTRNEKTSQSPNKLQTFSSTHKSPASKQTQSPTPRRKITYESVSTDRDCELLLTDRTNDTLADVNFTLPTDDCEYDSACDETVLRKCSDSSEAVKLMNVEPMKNLRGPRSGHSGRNSGLKPSLQELAAASKIVAYAKGYLVRRLLRTERVQATVQTIKDVLLCALQLHQDREGIRGADVDLHRRLIQQITAACYSLHETFVTSSAPERCALIAADRARRQALEARTTPPPHSRLSRCSDMSKSHSGVFSTRAFRNPFPSAMNNSCYETFSERAKDMKQKKWR